MTTFERVWKTLLANEASQVSRGSHRPGGPILTADATVAEVEAWLQWNDPNGCHLPEQCEAEGFERYDDDTAWEAAGQMIIDGAAPEWVAEYEKTIAAARVTEQGQG